MIDKMSLNVCIRQTSMMSVFRAEYSLRVLEGKHNVISQIVR